MSAVKLKHSFAITRVLKFGETQPYQDQTPQLPDLAYLGFCEDQPLLRKVPPPAKNKSGGTCASVVYLLAVKSPRLNIQWPEKSSDDLHTGH